MRLFHLNILAILSHGAGIIKAAPAEKEEQKYLDRLLRAERK